MHTECSKKWLLGRPKWEDNTEMDFKEAISCEDRKCMELHQHHRKW
jgi:hypothetical protein